MSPLTPSVRRRKDRPRRRTDQDTWRQHKPEITCNLPMMTLTKSEATTQLISIVSQFHPHAILIFPPHLHLHATRTQRMNQAAWSMDFDKPNAKLTVFRWRYFKILKVRVGWFKCHFIVFSALAVTTQLLHPISEKNSSNHLFLLR